MIRPKQKRAYDDPLCRAIAILLKWQKREKSHADVRLSIMLPSASVLVPQSGLSLSGTCELRLCTMKLLSSAFTCCEVLWSFSKSYSNLAGCCLVFYFLGSKLVLFLQTCVCVVYFRNKKWNSFCNTEKMCRFKQNKNFLINKSLELFRTYIGKVSTYFLISDFALDSVSAYIISKGAEFHNLTLW